MSIKVNLSFQLLLAELKTVPEDYIVRVVCIRIDGGKKSVVHNNTINYHGIQIDTEPGVIAGFVANEGNRTINMKLIYKDAEQYIEILSGEKFDLGSLWFALKGILILPETKKQKQERKIIEEEEKARLNAGRIYIEKSDKGE